jgi:hypothetical protein
MKHYFHINPIFFLLILCTIGLTRGQVPKAVYVQTNALNNAVAAFSISQNGALSSNYTLTSTGGAGAAVYTNATVPPNQGSVVVNGNVSHRDSQEFGQE